MPEVVQTIQSDCGKYRALIERHKTGLLRVEIEKWQEEWVPDYGKVGEFWERITQGASFTDSLQRAIELAEEKLRNAVSMKQ